MTLADAGVPEPADLSSISLHAAVTLQRAYHVQSGPLFLSAASHCSASPTQDSCTLPSCISDFRKKMRGRNRALIFGWFTFQHKPTSFNRLPAGDLKPQKETTYSDLNDDTF